MQVTRRSMLTGVERTLDLPVDPQLMAKYEQGGILVQHAFPHLTAAQREFILTGITEEEWDRMVAGDEEAQQ